MAQSVLVQVIMYVPYFINNTYSYISEVTVFTIRVRGTCLVPYLLQVRRHISSKRTYSTCTYNCVEQKMVVLFCYRNLIHCKEQNHKIIDDDIGRSLFNVRLSRTRGDKMRANELFLTKGDSPDSPMSLLPPTARAPTNGFNVAPAAAAVAEPVIPTAAVVALPMR